MTFFKNVPFFKCLKESKLPDINIHDKNNFVKVVVVLAVNYF
jgi:hypothetical protein